MPKKIFDIFPPKPTVPTQPTVHFEQEKPTPKLKGPKYLSQKRGLILVFLVLILAGIFAFWLLPRVQIEIWPETQILNLREKVEINAKREQSNFSAKIFPGKIFEVTKETSQEFPASGKVLKTEQAQGQIRVYNNYSTSSQVLVANTRFISAEGKLFRSVERVTIPGGKYERGKLVPGFLDIQVKAAEPGEDYNIGPSTFSIPGFAGTPRYTAFYGKSFSPMAGGFRGEVPQVTQADLDGAKNILANSLLEKSIAALKSELERDKISSDFILLNTAQTQEITEESSSVQAGAEVQSFNLRVKVRVSALVFRKSDLENFANEFILSQAPQDNLLPEEIFWSKKKIQPESLKMNYELSSIDWKEEKAILDLSANAKIYPDIDQTTLKKALFGKSLKETRILLEEQPWIKKSQVKFWPFWVKKVPQKEEKIKIELKFD